MELRVGFLMRTHHTRAPQHGLRIKAHRSRKPMEIMPELLIQIKDPSMIQTTGLVEVVGEGLLTLVAEVPRSGGLDLPAPQEAEPPPMAVATQGMALPAPLAEAQEGALLAPLVSPVEDRVVALPALPASLVGVMMEAHLATLATMVGVLLMTLASLAEVPLMGTRQVPRLPVPRDPEEGDRTCRGPCSISQMSSTKIATDRE
jgi:hypothetical protein